MISNRQLDKIAKEIVNIGSKFVDIQYKIEHCVPPVPHLFVQGIRTKAVDRGFYKRLKKMVFVASPLSKHH
jgi:hypothetical protein